MRRARDRQRGMTLIELMIAVLISSLLVGFVFGIYTRMSGAYRSQTSVGEVQQRLRIAKELIVRDLRPAGNLLLQGFQVNPAVDALSPLDLRDPVPPIMVTTGDELTPDEIRIFYADTALSTAVTNIIDPNQVIVQDASQFRAPAFWDDGPRLAVIIQTHPPEPTRKHYVLNACVVQLTRKPSSGTLYFEATGNPYNSAANEQCDFPPINAPGDPKTSILTPGKATNMRIYAFGARAYRIDPDRRDAGVLQLSLTGGLDLTDPTDWQDIGLGFTDLQVARQFFEPGDINDADLDGDPTMDWFSGVDSDPPPSGVTLPIDDAILTALSISLTARTTRQVDGPGSEATPALSVGDLNHNSIGNSTAIDLDGSQPEEFQGNHIYRSTTVRIDLRNIPSSRGFFQRRI